MTKQSAAVRKILRSDAMVLFMWGPLGRLDKPLSTRAFHALLDAGLTFKPIDVTDEPDLRQQVCRYSQCETFPQLFVNGEFLGGFFLIPELIESGELHRLVDRPRSRMQARGPEASICHAIWSLAVTDTVAISGAADRSILVWDCNGVLRQRSRLLGHDGWVNAVALDPSGSLVASGSSDTEIRVWNLSGCLPFQRCSGHSRWVNGLAFAPNGLLVSVSADRTLRVWQAEKGRELRGVSCHRACVWAVAISPDGLTIATGSQDCTIKLWDLDTLKCIKTLTGHRATVSSISFTPTGSLVSGSIDGAVAHWSSDGRIESIRREHEGSVWGVSASKKGALILSAGADRAVVVREGRSSSWKFHRPSPVTACACSPSGRFALVGQLCGEVFLRSLEPGVIQC